MGIKRLSLSSYHLCLVIRTVLLRGLNPLNGEDEIKPEPIHLQGLGLARKVTHSTGSIELGNGNQWEAVDWRELLGESGQLAW